MAYLETHEDESWGQTGGLHFWKGAESSILQEVLGGGGEKKMFLVLRSTLHPPPQQQQGDAMCEEAGDSHFLKLKGC